VNSRTTITISVKTKQVLESLKGNRSWDEFLLELVAEVQRIKREKNKRKLSELLKAEFSEVKVKNG